MTPEEFRRWEAASRDTVDFKRTYAHLAGDVLAGLHLSQIIYWFLPDRRGQSKLSVTYNGEECLVKAREEWFEEICLTGRQIDRTTALLTKMGIIKVEIHRFFGVPKPHIFVQWNRLMELLDKVVNEGWSNFTLADGTPRTHETVKTTSPARKVGNNEAVKSTLRSGKVFITETTTETTTEKQEARAAPVLSLLPGKEERAAPTNAPLPLTTFPEEPPPPASSPPPSPMLARTAGSSALAPAPAVEWDDLQAAPDSVRHGPITFPDDVDGWCQALIWLTTGWTATKFFATKPKAEHDKMWGQAKQHFKQGHSVLALLDKYQPGGWWYTLNAWKERRPTLHEISATWGDWEQSPVPFGPTAPPPANTREEWKPAEVQVHTYSPEQTAAMRQKFLQEAQNERERRNAERKAARQNGFGTVQSGARQ